MEEIRETAIRWVSSIRGVREDVPPSDDDGIDGLEAFLDRFGYEVDDVRRLEWLAAAVLVECGGALRDYVLRFGGDLARELEAAEAEAKAAMNGDPPTEESFRHELRHRGYRPAL